MSIQNDNSLCNIVSLLMLGTWKHQDFPSCLMVKIQDNQVVYINPMLREREREAHQNPSGFPTVPFMVLHRLLVNTS